MSDDASTPTEVNSLTDHPGWFGSGYEGSNGTIILGIHADWPAYPCAPGGGHGLFDLAQFPKDTLFEPLSDIDRCVLFSAYNFDPKKQGPPGDPWSRDTFQVAVWHEDLIALEEQGLIRGVTPISEREWRLRQHVEAGWKWGRKLYTEKEGEFLPVDWPELPPSRPDDEMFGHDLDYPAFEHEGRDSLVSITPSGWDLVTQELAASLEVPTSLPDLRKLLDSELYDSAVREVGIAIESALREAVGVEDGYGQKLAGDFVAHMKDELFAYNTILEIFRLRLRTFFKFVRNPHAHNKIELASAHALALIAHSLHLLDDIQQISRDKNA
ncbi:TIGR02391 family protein [Spirillospora sp. NBC_00431]